MRYSTQWQLAMLHNYYSTGDEVLSIFDTPDQDGSGRITVEGGTGGAMRYHAWQKQERFKGRFGVDAWLGNAGTSWMGWGLETFGNWTNGTPPMYELGDPALPYVTHVRTTRYTSAQAGAAIDSQLASDPVFRHDLMVGIPSGNMSDADKVFHLARGVPALSGPAGSHSFRDEIQVKNRDMDFLKTSPAWPRAGEQDFQGWRHSDIKDVALPFVLPVFERILSETTQ